VIRDDPMWVWALAALGIALLVVLVIAQFRDGD
jgi:hypothetical protein